MSKPKRLYFRPAYKRMWQAMNDENEGLRLEVANLRKENKSLKMSLEADKVECNNNRVYYNALSPYSHLPIDQPTPLYDQPKPRTWWERLWGVA